MNENVREYEEIANALRENRKPNHLPAHYNSIYTDLNDMVVSYNSEEAHMEVANSIDKFIISKTIMEESDVTSEIRRGLRSSPSDIKVRFLKILEQADLNTTELEGLANAFRKDVSPGNNTELSDTCIQIDNLISNSISDDATMPKGFATLPLGLCLELSYP